VVALAEEREMNGKGVGEEGAGGCVRSRAGSSGGRMGPGVYGIDRLAYD
jgi:hypothetical protein